MKLFNFWLDLYERKQITHMPFTVKAIEYCCIKNQISMLLTLLKFITKENIKMDIDYVIKLMNDKPNRTRVTELLDYHKSIN